MAPAFDPEQVNMIVNINTKGKQKIISFESQLLFVNNMRHPITLKFKVRKINEHAEKRKLPKSVKAIVAADRAVTRMAEAAEDRRREQESGRVDPQLENAYEEQAKK